MSCQKYCIFLAMIALIMNTSALIKDVEPYRVIQRTSSAGATFVIQGTLQQSSAAKVEVRVSRQLDSLSLTGFDWVRVDTFLNGTTWSGVVSNLPVGGEYRLEVRSKDVSGSVLDTEVPIEHLLVGDLWATLGQSNIEGRATFDSTSTDSARLPPSPIPQVHVITPYSKGWRLAVEPLSSGVSPCLSFAKYLYEKTGIPIGIVRSRKGAPIQEWERGKTGSAYFILDTIMRKHCGGKVKGVLWYQGENEALMSSIPALSGTGNITLTDYTTSKAVTDRYQTLALQLFDNLRTDYGTLETPVILAQLASLGGTMNWPVTFMREKQRIMGEMSPYNFTITTIDLLLMGDGLHLNLAGAKEVGKRFARCALDMAYDIPTDRNGPKFKRALFTNDRLQDIGVVFKNIAGRLLIESGRVPDFYVLESDTIKRVPQSVSLLNDSTVMLHMATAVQENATVGYFYGPAPSYLVRKALTDSSALPAMPFFCQTIEKGLNVSSESRLDAETCQFITVHPNPFNPTTTIKLTGIKSNGNAQVSIYDIRGVKIEQRTVSLTQLRNGFSWDGARHGSGIYTLRVAGNGFAMIRQLICIK
ncbi:MAG: T9SS type A sorting domain-containing protein [Fibrobacteres bacterium]|nr:T9SS type A sorting domain-containing protein [Fibrobacterota bacterium]